ALAPADTNAFVGIQVDQAQTSAFGQYILAQIDPGAEFNRFTTATGFDPRRDLRQILIAATGRGTGKNSGLILGRGAFQPDKLAAAAVLSGATKSTYSGIDIYTSTSKANQEVQSIAFLDPTLVLIGDSATLQSAIDRYRSRTAYTGSLTQRVNDVSNQYQA